MMSELVSAQNIIKKIQSKYYWLPEPSITGPEGGSSVKPIFLEISDDLRTQTDIDIIKLKLSLEIEKLNRSTEQATGQADVGGYFFETFVNTFDDTTSEAFGNVIESNLKKLSEIRELELAEANNSLRIIEIIMGEFSGLGLCDIIAILGALYTMDKNKLLGFLDDDAFKRAQSIIVLGLNSITKPSIQEALDELTKRVIDFYNLMDKIYKDVLKNNS